MEEDVPKHPAPKGVASCEQRAEVDRRDSVDAPAQQRLERDAAVRLEHEWIEEQHAELPIAGPRLALARSLERPDVHEDRLRPAPLDVVRRSVLDHQVLREARGNEAQLQQRRVLQHGERPLVRIRDEGEALVVERAHPGAARVEPLELAQNLLACLLGGDELTAGGERLEELGCRQRVPVGEPGFGQCPKDTVVVAAKDPCVPVPERAGLKDEARRQATRSDQREELV
jgi:hypothetical protein